MGTAVGWLVGIGVVLAIVFLGPYLAQRTMDAGGGSGGGGGPFGALSEIFHPAAHRAEASIVQEKQKEQAAPKGEGDDPGDGGDDDVDPS
jgi:hypothetical protein